MTKDKPILMSGPMVRAILEGRKTQTRRLCKLNAAGRVSLGGRNWHTDDPEAVHACPFGQPGDRLWVRETWGVDCCVGLKDRDCIDLAHAACVVYRATDETPDNGQSWARRWRPSIHMPRWASRITLEVVSVRVERVQDISEEDAIAEGLDQETCAGIFERAARGVEMKYGRWLRKANKDIDDDWCVDCVEKAAKKHKAEIDGWDDYPESDSTRWCEKCGSLLTHSLTKYGVERELFLESGLADDVQHFVARGQDAAVLSNLAGGIGDLRDEHLGRLAKIAFATLWDQLHGDGAWVRNDLAWVVEFRRIDSVA